MKNITRSLTVLVLMLIFTSCQQKTTKEQNGKEDNSVLQSQLLNYTKKINVQAKKDSSNSEKLENAKLEYTSKVNSIKICNNWKGKITLLDLDEVEDYSKDTVVMRIGIENNYDKGDQDYFSFVEVKPIPKNGKLYKKLNSIKKNSDIVFSGKILGVKFNNITPGYEFSNFFIATEFSDINPVNK
jgi:outer membrane PBP1 activator LpoA protein